VIFKNFFAESEKNCTWQRNSLPRVDQLALGKEIFGECSFLCRELFVCLSAKKPVCQVFLLCRESNKKLSAKLYLTLGTDSSARQSRGGAAWSRRGPRTPTKFAKIN
jgi:hypothetical protein